MEKIKWPVIIVTAYAFFYQLTPSIGLSDQTVITLFIVSPMAVLWMAYKILRQGIPSGRTFDDYFYEDSDYKRNRVDGA